ncbi:unnamed protein product, partial [Sphacelaria rigidula]
SYDPVCLAYCRQRPTRPLLSAVDGVGLECNDMRLIVEHSRLSFRVVIIHDLLTSE